MYLLWLVGSFRSPCPCRLVYSPDDQDAINPARYDRRHCLFVGSESPDWVTVKQRVSFRLRFQCPVTVRRCSSKSLGPRKGGHRDGRGPLLARVPLNTLFERPVRAFIVCEDGCEVTRPDPRCRCDPFSDLFHQGDPRVLLFLCLKLPLCR